MNGQHLRLMMGGPHIAGGSSKRKWIGLWGWGGAYRFCIGDTNPDRTTVREHPYGKPSVTKLPDPYEALPYVLSASCSSNAWDAKLKSANYVQMARSPNSPLYGTPLIITCTGPPHSHKALGQSNGADCLTSLRQLLGRMIFRGRIEQHNPM